MYPGLLILGVLVTLAGVAMFAFGVSNNGFDVGNTMLIAGTVAFCGGLILVALAEAVRQLRRISEGLMARPVGVVPRADVSEPAPHVAPAPAASPRIPFPPKPEPRSRAPMPAMASEPRLDTAPSIDSTDEHFDRPPAFARRAPEPRIAERDETPLSPAQPRFAAEREERDELAEGLLATAFSRLDVSPRTAPPPAADTPKQSGMFESMWPSTPRKPSEEVPPMEAEAPEVETPHAELPEEEPKEQDDKPEEPYAVSILKSGVVDGMAYTLYSDGSIEAEMPQGTMRFASITELRAYLEKSSS